MWKKRFEEKRDGRRKEKHAHTRHVINTCWRNSQGPEGGAQGGRRQRYNREMSKEGNGDWAGTNHHPQPEWADLTSKGQGGPPPDVLPDLLQICRQPSCSLLPRLPSILSSHPRTLLHLPEFLFISGSPFENRNFDGDSHTPDSSRANVLFLVVVTVFLFVWFSGLSEKPGIWGPLTSQTSASTAVSKIFPHYVA